MCIGSFCNTMEAFMIKHRFCNVKYRNTIYENMDTTLCVVSRPNFGYFLAGSSPSPIKSTHFCIQQNYN